MITTNINDYKDRMTAPKGAIRTGGKFMTLEMKATAVKAINDYAQQHKTSTPCLGLVCQANEEYCTETCPLAGYCKEGFYDINEAEAFARHLILTGYDIA